MRSDVINIRSKVEKREILQYLKLRQRVLQSSEINANRREAKLYAKCRHSEIQLLLNLIKDDTIRPKIRELHQQIQKYNSYKKNELPEEAVKGLTSALEDVKKGDYIEVVDDVSQDKRAPQPNKVFIEKAVNLSKGGKIQDLFQDGCGEISRVQGFGIACGELVGEQKHQFLCRKCKIPDKNETSDVEDEIKKEYNEKW